MDLVPILIILPTLFENADKIRRVSISHLLAATGTRLGE
jgi:hypothetical protein